MAVDRREKLEFADWSPDLLVLTTKLKFIGSDQTNLRAEAPKAPMEHKYISFILHIYISSFFVF